MNSEAAGLKVGIMGDEVVLCISDDSDIVPGPLNGTAEHHTEDHPKDLWRDGGIRDVTKR